MTSPILSIVEGWGVLISINLQGVNVNWNDGERVVRLQMCQMISLNQKSNSILRFFNLYHNKFSQNYETQCENMPNLIEFTTSVTVVNQGPSVINHQPIRPVNHGLKSKDWKKKILGHGPGHVEQKPFNLWKPNIFPVGLPSFWSIFSTFCALSDPQKPPGSANDCTVEGQHIRGALSSSRKGPVQNSRVCGWNRWDRLWLGLPPDDHNCGVPPITMVYDTYNIYSTYNSWPGWWCNFTILKNDGVRQWEGWHPIYEMENKIHVPKHQPDK